MIQIEARLLYEEVLPRDIRDQIDPHWDHVIRDDLHRLYQVLGLISYGGLSTVLKAYDCTLGRVVAIKIVTLAVDSLFLAGLQEAQTHAQLADNHTVAVYHVFQCPDTVFMEKVSHSKRIDVDREKSVSVIVMEYLGSEFQTVEQLLQNGELDNEEIAEIIRVVCLEIDRHSKKKYVWADPKADNIFLRKRSHRFPSPFVKISDFGISRSTDDDTLPFAGTPRFMAPEAFSGIFSLQSELYSVGLLLVRMLTGRSLGQELPTKTLLKQRKIANGLRHEDTIVLINLLEQRGYSQNEAKIITNVVEKLLMRLPENRYTTGAEVAQILCPVIEQKVDADRLLKIVEQTTFYSDTTEPFSNPRSELD